MKVYNKVVMDISGRVIEEDSFEYQGEVAKCGGGSATNASDYPSYIKDTHHNWLKGDAVDSGDEMTYSIVDLMNTAQGAGGNPYEGETAFDPNAALTLTTNSPLERMSTRFTTTQTLIDAIDADVDWGGFIDYAATKYAKFSDIDFLDSLSTAISGLLSVVESALSSTAITNLVTAFENNKKVRFLRDQSLFTAGMADVNAVHTSSFMIGLALQQIEFSNSVDQYEREVKASIYSNIVQSGIDSYMKANVVRMQNKDAMLLDGARVMVGLETFKGQMSTQLVQLKAEVERLIIIAKQEQTNRQLDIDVDEGEWDLKVYQYGANLLASAAGGVIHKGAKTSDAQSALGGALAGASIGSQVGGTTGAGIGAVAGGILGWALN